ncbi:radical SAM protein, partial [Candidatus Gottesmanbacteria bacterium]|nr:radical SAM protein [Candidatus Gottesmanbacteria bacterium]
SFMGMGEPFSNPENVFEALHILTNKDFLGIGDRHINVSTVGIVPQIRRLTKEFPQVNLAFSLHSPFPDQRLQLMPVTKAYPIDKVFEALDERIKATKRRVFLAYLLLAGVNDTKDHVKALVDLIKKRGPHAYLYHVNLIRFNPGPGETEFNKASRESVDSFKKYLLDNNISCSLRQSFGLNIFAACGQLYGGYQKKNES